MSKEELEWRRQVEFVEIDVANSAHVTQITNFGASMGRLVPDDGSDDMYDEDPEGSLEEAREYLRIIAAKLPRDRDVLLITYKDAEDYIRQFLPQNVQLDHFGAFRGIDSYKDCDDVWIVGRNLPQARDVERIAEAYWWDRPDVDLNLTGKYVPAIVRWRLKSGEDGPLTEAWRHPCPQCEAVRESLCEAEIVQAVGRIRPIRATTKKRVVLISGVPTLPADRLVPWKEFIGEEKYDRFAELLVRERGAVLLSRRYLTKKHPDLFPTEARALHAIDQLINSKPTEIATGIDGIATPITLIKGRFQGTSGAQAWVLTTLPARTAAVTISRNTGANIIVEEPKPAEPLPGAAPNRGPRHYVMRADPVEIETSPDVPKAPKNEA